MKNEIPHPIYNNYKRNNQIKNKKQKSKNLVRPNSASVNSLGEKSSFFSHQKSFNIEDDYNYNQPKLSMFDEYYKDKLIKRNNYNTNNNNINGNHTYNEKIEHNNNQNQNNIIKNNNINDNNYELDNKINKINHRPLSRTNNNMKQKDFLADSKYIISCIQKANNSNRLKQNYSKTNPYHKEFGKTPKYLQNMKIESEKKKELEKLKKETSKYPKGTRLLSEEERLFTLEKLKQSKNDINQVIEKLPITCDSQAFRNKKEELFKKLDEIESAIETFSKKKVFVKIEDKE